MLYKDKIMHPIPHEPTPERRYSQAVTESLTDKELQVLTLLRDAPPNGISCRQLQQLLNLPVNNIRTMCNKLNALGLLHISDGANACSGRLYSLTPLGRTLRI